MNISDKINKRMLGKKEPTLFDAYFSLLGAWIAIGWWFMMGIIIMIIPLSSEYPQALVIYFILIGLFFIAMSIFYGVSEIRENIKTGFADLLKSYAIKRWHEKRKKYGLE